MSMKPTQGKQGRRYRHPMFRPVDIFEDSCVVAAHQLNERFATFRTTSPKAQSNKQVKKKELR